MGLVHNALDCYLVTSSGRLLPLESGSGEQLTKYKIDKKNSHSCSSGSSARSLATMYFTLKDGAFPPAGEFTMIFKEEIHLSKL